VLRRRRICPLLAKLPDAFARQNRFRGTKRQARGESAFERSSDSVEFDFGIAILERMTYELEVRLLSRHERHDGQLAELDT
jgi:hypothetical protein